jgi:hypothetical protein
MNFEVADLVHKQIILDLTIRTLERDRNHLGDIKMLRAFELWVETKLNELHLELKATKTELGRNGAKIQSHKLDSDFTEYTIIERGNASIKRYSNIALRNWTEEEVKRLLGLKYKTPYVRK